MPRKINPHVSGIYRILCKVTGDCYIGQSRDIYLRWSGHRNKLRKGEHLSVRLQSDWNKYGESAFEFAVIEEVKGEKIVYDPNKYAPTSWRRLYEREYYYIRLERPAYNTNIP